MNGFRVLYRHRSKSDRLDGKERTERERERERERDYADCVLMRVVFGGWVPGPLSSEV